MNAVGQPISRIDGQLKVTGSARYTADIPLDAIVHAAIVYSTIANGRIVSIDTAAAENAPDVLAVLTNKNMPRMKALPWSHLRPQGQTYLPLQDDQIHYAGQPVALVVAATLDQATYAGTLIKVAYEAHPPVVFDLRTAKEDAVEPPQRMWPLSSSVGDADKAIAGAAVKIEQTYTMSDRHHNPMEPHATLAVWDGDGSLTLYDSTQMVVGTKKLVSLVLGIPEEKINVVCEFLGGGFGGKSWSWPHTLLAALAAKVVNRPVRLQLSRAQMYSMVGQTRSKTGVLEVALHTNGGTLAFNGYTHEQFVDLFHAIGSDRDNRVVILTGSGNAFMETISPEGFDFFTPQGYDKIYREGRKVLMNILDIEVPLIAAVNGPMRLHSEYILLADIVLATPSTVFQDKPHFELGVASGDGVHLLWQEAIGTIRGRYFILTRQELDAQTAKEWGAVNEIVPADKLLPRAREIAEGLAKLPSLTTKYTRIAMTQKLRRIIDEGVTLGLALEGISAADVARAK